jgi:hypothetical protein
MNDFRRLHDYAELAAVYRASRIGVNVPQDRFLRDANLRAFEIMAGGALLLTPHPSELTELGFKVGEHFQTFVNKSDLLAQVDHYLANDEERDRIARAGQVKTINEFNYQIRAKQILGTLCGLAAQKERFRVTSADEVSRIYLRHYARHSQTRQMRRYLQRLRMHGELTLPDRRAALAGELRSLKRAFQALWKRITRR